MNNDIKMHQCCYDCIHAHGVEETACTTCTTGESIDEVPSNFELETREVITQGTCQFCHESAPVRLSQMFYTQENADYDVSMRCDCAKGRQMRIRLNKQELYDTRIADLHKERLKRAEKRNSIKIETIEVLDELFGNKAVELGKVKMDDEVLDYLLATAMMVYDKLIGSFSTLLFDGVSVKIALKDNTLSVERMEKSRQKQEVV